MDVAAYRREGRLDGQCLCGAVRIEIDGGHVAAVGVCHCLMCRRWSGTGLAGFEADAGAVTVTGAVERYRSSDFAERAFCPTCGSHLWFRILEDGAPYEFAAGFFPGADDFPLISELYVDGRPAYLPLGGEHATATAAAYEAGHRHVAADP